MATRGEWRTHTEDAWNWDLSGFVVAPSVLSETELREAREATSLPGPLNADALTEHPSLMSLIRRLCGEGAPLFGHAKAEERIEFRLDRPARLVTRSEEQQSCAGDHHRLRYDTTARPDMVVVKGVRALWVLDDTTEVVVVPATHKASLPAPSLMRMEEMDTSSRPMLQAGDLLLLAATTLFGLRPPDAVVTGSEAPRVVELVFADKQLSAPELGYVERPLADIPEWMHDLSDAQLAVVRPGLMGMPSASLTTDGRTVELANLAVDTDQAIRDIAAGEWSHGRQQHCAEEMWQWDAQGYCVARSVMDDEWLSAANTALDAYRNDSTIVREIADSELWQEPDCSNTLRPSGYESGSYRNEERMSNLEWLPSPHKEPFQRMIAHPAGRKL